MSINWWVTPNPNACPQSACGSAGASQNKTYVTLATPYNTGDTTPTSAPATVLYLATAGGPAATSEVAFQNTWSMFTNSGTGPANVLNWQGQQLYYYRNDPPGTPGGMVVPFSGCAYNASGLLTQANGSGQCGSWALLFLETLAANGIPVQMSWQNPVPQAQAFFTGVCPADSSNMLVKTWSFNGSATYANNPYLYAGSAFSYLLKLNSSDSGDGMVPQPSGGFGDLSNEIGLQGQNSATPSEKAFGSHYIVSVPPDSRLTNLGPYFDPSYGVTYGGSSDFEQHLVGYDIPIDTGGDNALRAIVPGQSVPNIRFPTVLPTGPTLSVPANGAVGQPTTVQFSWQPPPTTSGSQEADSTVYAFWLSADGGQTFRFVTVPGTTPNLTLPGFSSGGARYYWYVTATNCLNFNNYASRSMTFSFTTQ